MKKLLTLLLLTSGLISVFAQEKIDKSANSNQEFDIVILNGRVMDPETLFDDVANVGIKDGRIATITKQQIKGKETINAKGHVVSPGFIDTHYHTTDLFGAKLGVADGITTAMDLEHGATRIGEWYDNMAKRGAQVNYGSCMIMVGARMLVHDSEVEYNEPLDLTNLLGYINKTAKDGTQGWSVTRSNVDQMNEIMKLLDDGLREGAIGIGVGAAYMARGLTTYEQFEAQRVASRYGRLTSVHNRFHLSSETPSEAQIGFDEVFANALILNAPLLLCHDNDYGWWEHQEKLQMARAQGHNMWGEYYPFTAGQTGISADYLRPEIWEDNYGYKYEETIYDPILDKY
jgi:N-acyl-D-amino-acid deacylase